MITQIVDRIRVVLTLTGPLKTGSRALLARLLGRFGWKAVWTGLGLALYVVVRYPTGISWLALAWCAAAWVHAPADTSDEEAGAETTPKDAGGLGEQHVTEPLADPLPGILQGLIGEAPGVHVKRVVEWLHESGQDTSCTAADVRAALAHREIPLRASVRDGAGRVNQGVHRDDLKAWVEAAPPTTPTPLSKACSTPATTPLTSDVAKPLQP